MDDLELLQAYVDRQDQEAFAQLVQRHGTWLYSAARRQLRDGHLAEDAAQAALLLLVQRARPLRCHSYLSGWLFVAMGYCVRQMKRERRRMAQREQETAMMRPEKIEAEVTWEAISPLLEEAVGQLGRQERDAVLLRFYEQKALAEVGRCLGISEKAAQKRVERAVGKLREKLSGKGVEVEAGSLGAMVLAHAVEGGGPAGLVKKVMAGIGGGTGNGTAGLIAQGAAKMMVLAKVKVAAVVLGLLIAVMGGVVAAQMQLSPATSQSRPALDFFELCKTGTVEQVQQAIAAGAEVNAKDKTGWTPLVFAAMLNPNPEVITVLVKAGADINAKTPREETVLMLVTEFAKPEAIMALLKAGGDANAKDKDGQTLLMGAGSWNPNPEAITVLAKAGGNVNAKDKNGWTPLMFAAIKNPNPEVVAALVKAGGNVNTKDNWGCTPPIYAAGNNPNSKMIAALLKAGGDVNAKETRGGTPLMNAAQSNPNPEVITVLVEAGADMSAKDAKGESVLDCGRENKNPEVLAELVKAGAK